MFKFESSINHYADLLERDYLESLYKHLQAEMGSRINDYDFVLWSNMGEQDSPVSIALTGRKPKVLLHISDETSSAPFHLTHNFAAIFKCFLLREFPEHKIFALPLGYASSVPNLPVLPMSERKYNVCFLGCPQKNRMQFSVVLSKLVGRAYRDSMRNGKIPQPAVGIHQGFVCDFSEAFPNSYIRFTSGFSKGLDRVSYGAILRDSKIALCPGGWKSNETYRHFEAMRAGCVLISDPLPETRLYRDAPIIRITNWQRLEETVSQLLRSPERMLELQRLTLAWWEDVCSEKATAAYIRAQLIESRPCS